MRRRIWCSKCDNRRTTKVLYERRQVSVPFDDKDLSAAEARIIIPLRRGKTVRRVWRFIPVGYRCKCGNIEITK
jgi:hypothetical protein